MDADVYEMFYNRKEATGYVFEDGGEPFTHKSITTRLRKVCKSAGLRRIGWHTLRHTFASHLVMRGVPLTVVKALMGHSDIKTTMRYAHLAPSMLRDAIETLSPKILANGTFGQPVVNTWQEAQRADIASKIPVLKSL